MNLLCLSGNWESTTYHHHLAYRDANGNPGSRGDKNPQNFNLGVDGCNWECENIFKNFSDTILKPYCHIWKYTIFLFIWISKGLGYCRMIL